MLPYLITVNKASGIAIHISLASAITAKSFARTAALHDKYFPSHSRSETQPHLQQFLKLWMDNVVDMSSKKLAQRHPGKRR